MSDELAPALSTAQTDDAFQFDKLQVDEVKHRPHIAHYQEGDKKRLRDLLAQYYLVDQLASELIKAGYKTITLQFPDLLICDSSYVVLMLQDILRANYEGSYTGPTEAPVKCAQTCGKATCCSEKSQKDSSEPPEVWVLADTSYSDCCVDEVAAEHVGGDVVVHFGDSCLTPIQKLKSIYVFGEPQVDLAEIQQKFKAQYPDTSSKVVLMADTSYSYTLEKLHHDLVADYPNLVYSRVYNLDESINIINYHNVSENEGFVFGNRILMSLQISSEEQLQDYELFHISVPKPPRLLFLGTKFSSLAIYNPYSQSVDTGPFPSLMKRYRFMHIARTAGTIGILVNTLSLSNTKKMIEVVRDWIKAADKKCYMFVVGKPNVAKLANFEVVDAWCVLGCGQGGIIVDDTSEYYKPIVSPYELSLALSKEVTWTGKWITDFKSIISLDESQEVAEKQEELSDDDYAPEFSAVTGQYVSTSRPLRQVPYLQVEKAVPEVEDETQLVKKFTLTVTIRGNVSTSAIALQKREWTGLGSDFTAEEGYDDTGADVEEGRFGVARDYNM